MGSPAPYAALHGKRILLGITGSIAAYKSAILARELQRRGATVRVIMTPGAIEFITPARPLSCLVLVRVVSASQGDCGVCGSRDYYIIVSKKALE